MIGGKLTGYALRQLAGTPLAVNTSSPDWCVVLENIASFAFISNLPVISYPSDIGPVVVHTHVADQKYTAVLNSTRIRAIHCKA